MENNDDAKRKNLDGMFYPESVAVVGASTVTGKIGNLVIMNLVNDGYTGKIYPVNPKASDVLGVKTYPSIAEIPSGRIDLGVIIVAARFVLDAVRELAKKDCHALVVISSGFGESGPDGMKLEAELLALARENSMRIIGPNCLGIASTQVLMNASFGMPLKGSGTISFISQSGAFADGVLGWAQDAGIGFDKFVSIGNKSDLDDAELCEYFANDSRGRTRCIALYVEGMKNGRKFYDAMKRVTPKVPVVAIKAGTSRSGAIAASSHTGSLAGSDEIFSAAFRQSGVIRAKNVEDLFDMSKALAMQPPAPGKRIAILTNAGGLGVLSADFCEELGMEVNPPNDATYKRLREHMPAFGSAKNPIDFTAQGTPEEQTDMYCTNYRTLVADHDYDGIIVICEGNAPVELISMLRDGFIKTHNEIKPKKPVVFCWMASNTIDPDLKEIEKQSGVPCYSIPKRATVAMSALVRYGEFLGNVKRDD